MRSIDLKIIKMPVEESMQSSKKCIQISGLKKNRSEGTCFFYIVTFLTFSRFRRPAAGTVYQFL